MTNELQEKLTELTIELGVPGVAAAIISDDRELFAFSGVTSV